jgi:Holliday junction DNA helicase RuvA
VDTLQRGIATGDLALLASVSGIGKRTAERIVVELRDKLGAAALETAAVADGATAPAPDDPHVQARDALVALGFAVAEAESALSEADGSTEQRIKIALAALRRGGPA